MDAFLTDRQKALRALVRERFRGWRSLSRPDRDPPDRFPDGVMEDAAGSTLLERVLVLEAVSFESPCLGRELRRRVGSNDGNDIPADPGLEAAESLGTAAFVLEACNRAARGKNLFAGVIMEAGRTQQDMADFASALEAVRFETYRSFFLLERNMTGQGGAELERAAARAMGLQAGILRMAAGLLGEDWLRENLPAETFAAGSVGAAAPSPSSPRKATEPKERSGS